MSRIEKFTITVLSPDLNGPTSGSQAGTRPEKPEESAEKDPRVEETQKVRESLAKTDVVCINKENAHEMKLKMEANRKRTVSTSELNGTTAQGTAVNVAVNKPEAAEQSAAVDPAQGTAAAQGTAFAGEALAAVENSPSYTVSLTRKDGTTLEVGFHDNLQIQERGDGRTSVYFSDSNTTRQYGADGLVTEQEGNTLSADADTTIINTSGSTVRAGNGNNLIFNFANNTEIHGGSGDDTIVLANDISGNVIDTGAGNDTVKGVLITDSIINVNEGNNTIDFVGVDGGKISAGNGDNTIDITVDFYRGKAGTGTYDKNNDKRDGTIRNCDIEIGDGNNTIIGSASKNVRFSVGDGNNTAKIASVKYGSTVIFGNGNNTVNISGVGYDSTATFGDGNNSLTVDTVAYNGKVNIGDGNNKLEFSRVGQILEGYTALDGQLARILYEGEGAQVNIGNGNNTINAGAIRDNGSMRIGDGNNTINAGAIRDNGSMHIGDGNNRINSGSVLESGSFEIGDGNNTISFYCVSGDGTMTIGNGNNALSMHSVANNGSLNIGDGDNVIDMSSTSHQGTIDVGNGTNSVKLHTVQNKSTVTFGGGNNAIRMYSIDDESRVDVGDGNNDIAINKMTEKSLLTIGNGDNLMRVLNMSGNSLFSLGNGNNFAIVDKMSDMANAVNGGGKLLFLGEQLDDIDAITYAYAEEKTARAEKGLSTTSFTARGSRVPEDIKGIKNPVPKLGAPRFNLDFGWNDNFGRWDLPTVNKLV